MISTWAFLGLCTHRELYTQLIGPIPFDLATISVQDSRMLPNCFLPVCNIIVGATLRAVLYNFQKMCLLPSSNMLIPDLETVFFMLKTRLSWGETPFTNVGQHWLFRAAWTQKSDRIFPCHTASICGSQNLNPRLPGLKASSLPTTQLCLSFYRKL